LVCVPKLYSESYKHKLVACLTGPRAVTARELAKETGIHQQTLSRWLEESRSVSPMVRKKGLESPIRPPGSRRSAADKARLLTQASELEGDALLTMLGREGVTLIELDEWRLALEDVVSAQPKAFRRIRALERELRRKDKALAEAAALLILKKRFIREFRGTHCGS